MDYDGTLADFEPTPDLLHPDPALARLLSDLAQRPGVRLAVISGRRLADLRVLLPVAGIWLAGAYGTEWWTPQGELIERVDKSRARPTLDAIKAEWEQLVADEPKLHLEDKGMALALHARYVEDRRAATTLAAARRAIERHSPPGLLRILGGNKFLEAAPALADKGRAIEYLLNLAAWPDAELVFIGDDDKDEAAFAAVNKLGGVGILVSKEMRPTKASYILESPQQTRQWLTRIARERPSSAG